MAQEPASPWSRWDVPGYRYVPHNVIQPISNRQFDSPSYVLPQPGTQAQSLSDATLLEQRVNGKYTTTMIRLFMIVSTDFQTRFNRWLSNATWIWVVAMVVAAKTYHGTFLVLFVVMKEFRKEKYGAAVALICIFCAIVIIAFIVWLIIWLINRSRDKAQRANYEAQMTTPSPPPIYAPAAPNGYPY
ncbi:hypothetical protein M3Y98_00389800 [Aphelenchoides besseyi]|nr:hypothetical protein M3Y98_00389800 [Aphelenchoides besseyi]KAI6202391.1 hypothetical protein M3Y96_00943600 [Aphelenchoides besseyi]